jgi:hypothetical protein
MLRNCASPRTSLQHAAHETFIVAFLIMPRLRGGGAAPAAQRRARHDLDLSAHPVAAGRLQLPPFADLLGLWRRGDRAFRAVGRRLDDAGAAVTLPAMGHIGNRQRAADKAAGRTMVFAVAVRAMARRQRALNNLVHCFQAKDASLPCGEPRPHSRIDLMLPQAGHKQCAGKSATTVTIPDRSTFSPYSRFSLLSSRLTGISPTALRPRARRPSSCRAKACGGKSKRGRTARFARQGNALAFSCSSMIFSENRLPLFRIML